MQMGNSLPRALCSRSLNCRKVQSMRSSTRSSSSRSPPLRLRCAPHPRPEPGGTRRGLEPKDSFHDLDQNAFLHVEVAVGSISFGAPLRRPRKRLGCPLYAPHTPSFCHHALSPKHQARLCRSRTVNGPRFPPTLAMYVRTVFRHHTPQNAPQSLSCVAAAALPLPLETRP